MKKNRFLLKLLTGVLLLMVPPMLCHAAINQIFYTAHYNGTPIFGTDTLGGVTYSTITYGDLVNGGEPGMPSLPIDYLKFSVPYNATNFTVIASLNNNSSTRIKHPIYPCQPPRIMNDTIPIVITPPNDSVYNSGSYYPSNNVWVVDEGFLAGENHLVTIAVMPISFVRQSMGNSYANYLRISKTISIVLSYELSDTPAMSPIVRQDTSLRQEGYILTQSMVVNPNDVINNSPSVTSLSGLQDECSYLIVTTPELQHSMRRLAALNRQKGYTINCITMDDVMSDSLASCGDSMDTGHIYNSDSASVLREYLRNHYTDNGLKYVLLAGDVPYRIYVKNGEDYLTDWYFSDLNGKWSDFIHDKEAELIIGRIVAKTDEQINNYTNKLLMYELNPGKGDYSYLRKGFYSTGRDFPGFLDNVIDTLMRIIPDTIIINDFKNNNSRYPKGHDIIDTIRTSRVGFMCIFNHGDTTRTKVYGKDSQDYNYFIKAISTESSGNGLNCLNNKYYPIIYYSPSCATVPFDNKYTQNFGESFTTGKDYGGPVYIGHTREVAAIESRIMTEKFAKQLVQGSYQLGAAYTFSTGFSAPSCKEEIYTNCYLGDPIIELWSSTPQMFSDIGISRNDNSINLTGIDADSTIVAYCNNDYNQGKQTVSNPTVALDGLSPNSIITIYKRDYLPLIMPIELQNITLLNSQYVFANDFIAGSHINNNRTEGSVTVKSGAEYEIEVSGVVKLYDGVEIEKGATFIVRPSSIR